MAAATPRAAPVQHSPPLSLRSQGGTVTPLPDLDVVDLGRRGLLAPDITSPRVSRRQATLLRDEAGNLRVVAQGVNPTAVLTARGELVRLAGGSGSDVEVGDTIVLCPGRMLRDGGARVLDGDEAYTIVEAEIDNLPAALREIKRLRTELAARPPAPPWLGRRTPAAEEPEATAAADADDADADDKTEDARGGASDDDTDRGTKRRADDGDVEPPAEAKRRRRGNCVIC